MHLACHVTRLVSHQQETINRSVITVRDEKYVMAHQLHQLSLLQRLMPSAKKVPGGVKGRVSMTLQDGATTSDILTGILQVNTCTFEFEAHMRVGQALHLTAVMFVRLG